MDENTRENVVVFAARSDIGQAVIGRLRRRNANVALIGRELRELDGDDRSFMRECDLTDFDAVDEAMGEARDRMGELTGCLNGAGSILLKPAHLTSRLQVDDAIESNFITAFAIVRAAARHFGASGGSVVLISSAAATLGMPNHEVIGAVKGAVEGLVRSAAATYASRSIRFNAVAPGLIATKLTEDIVGNATSRKISESLHPLGRIGAPEDVASAICWLLDPTQSWITGQVIGVDGGLSRVQPRPRIGATNR